MAGTVIERAGGGAVTGEKPRIQKTYFDVLGLCCSSEIALIEKILGSLQGVKEVSVFVPTKTVRVIHDSAIVSSSDIAKQLNEARLEANVRVNGETSYRQKWPSPSVLACGLLLGLSFLKYVYDPLKWLAVAAVAAGIWQILMRGVAAVRNFTLDVNILVIIAVAGTLALQDFWEAGTIVFLFTIAEWLQSRASHKANAVMLSLMNIAPQKATIAETGELVGVEDVKLGTVLAVKTGEAIPIDGTVVEGCCEVDEKALTGEAFPVSKQVDSNVWAGTINLNGYISVKTTALSDDCVVSKMAKLVEEAQSKKPRFEKLIDECAKYYTPAVVLLSAGLVIIPAAMRVHNVSHWAHLALVVLVSACPCGLILSTPVATFCALSKAATSGLLIKGGDYIETLSKIKTVAFDKTGTITRGEFVMTDFKSLTDDISVDALLYWVASVESKSSHPIADAIVHYCKSQSIEPKQDFVQDFQNFPGEGVAGVIDGKELYIGNRKLSQRAGCLAVSEATSSSEDGRTLGYVYSAGSVIGTFSLSDTCRTGAGDAIRELTSMGIRTALLTGDSHAAATRLHDLLQHALDEVHAELLPEDKARIIENYKKSGPTAMVGDGVNDAPALATADVGISMGVSGSALASETGHIILMSNNIKLIPKAIRLAKRTQNKVIQNIIFSIATKTIVLAVAFAGHPIIWVAVLADVLTCLLVILNSMLLLRNGHNRRHHDHAHDKKAACNMSSEMNHVHVHEHEHEASCQVSGVHNHHHCVVTRRSKAVKHSGYQNIKCDSDPLVNCHQHLGEKDKCKDLEGQVAACLDEATSSELQVGHCHGNHSDNLIGDANLNCIDEDEINAECDHVHDHVTGHEHRHESREVASCCKSFMEECRQMHVHSPVHVHFAGSPGGGLSEILSG